MGRLGLQGRAILFCLALILGTVCALSSALIWQHYHQSVGHISRHSVVDARTLSRLAEPAVLLHDREGLEQVVQAAAGDTSLELVQILDQAGVTLATYQRNVHFTPELTLDASQPILARTGPDALSD